MPRRRLQEHGLIPRPLRDYGLHGARHDAWTVRGLAPCALLHGGCSVIVVHVLAQPVLRAKKKAHTGNGGEGGGGGRGVKTLKRSSGRNVVGWLARRCLRQGRSRCSSYDTIFWSSMAAIQRGVGRITFLYQGPIVARKVCTKDLLGRTGHSSAPATNI